MITDRSHMLRALLIVSLGQFYSAPASAENAACKPVVDAMMKSVTTPSHTFTTTTALASGGKPIQGEHITTGTRRYLLLNGKWVVSKESTKDLLEEQQENAKSSKLQCRLMREERIAGESATLYSVHEESDYGKSDEQIWISGSSGLPLKVEIDIRVDGDKIASHMSSHMTYENIKAPEGLER